MNNTSVLIVVLLSLVLYATAFVWDYKNEGRNMTPDRLRFDSLYILGIAILMIVVNQ